MASTSVAELKERGNKSFKEGRYLEAVSHFSQALALDPSNHVLYSNRSAAYANLHRYEEALADGEAAVNLKPDWAKGYSRVATAYFALENWDDAVVAYMQGLELDPYNESLREGLRASLTHANKREARSAGAWTSPRRGAAGRGAGVRGAAARSHGGEGGGDCFTSRPMHTWTADHVAQFLHQLELHALVDTFRENGVNGHDLLTLSDEDFVKDLSMSRLQLRKLRAGVAELHSAFPGASHPGYGAPNPVHQQPGFQPWPPSAAGPGAPGPYDPYGTPNGGDPYGGKAPVTSAAAGGSSSGGGPSGSMGPGVPDPYASNPYVQQFSKSRPGSFGTGMGPGAYGPGPYGAGGDPYGPSPPPPHHHPHHSWGSFGGMPMPPQVHEFSKPHPSAGMSGGPYGGATGPAGAHAAANGDGPESPVAPNDPNAPPGLRSTAAAPNDGGYSTSYSFKPTAEYKARKASFSGNLPAAAGDAGANGSSTNLSAQASAKSFPDLAAGADAGSGSRYGSPRGNSFTGTTPAPGAAAFAGAVYDGPEVAAAAGGYGGENGRFGPGMRAGDPGDDEFGGARGPQGLAAEGAGPYAARGGPGAAQGMPPMPPAYPGTHPHAMHPGPMPPPGPGAGPYGQYPTAPGAGPYGMGSPHAGGSYGMAPVMGGGPMPPMGPAPGHGGHMRIPSIDMAGSDPYMGGAVGAKGAVMFRELAPNQQVPPVVKVHPQLKVEANWVQRIIQSLLAPRNWELSPEANGQLKEMNNQKNVVQLKTAMAQAVALGFFEQKERGSGAETWTQSRGFVVSNLGWREGQPVWTAPCFYEIKSGLDRAATQQGYQDVATCFVINSPEALRKMARGKPVLGIDITMKHGFSTGPGDGDGDVPHPKAAEIVTFSVKRGTPIDLNLSGGRIVGGEENFSYYGRGCTPERILGGKVPQPEEFMGAYKTITSLMVGGATLLTYMRDKNYNGQY